jgi:imidazolonepropionase-like amidohydrolase
MTFVNEYKNRGGRVVAGADLGYMWATFGFGFVRNLELLQEAGFTPLEAIRAASWNGAQLLRMDREIGSIEVGKLADLLIVDGNPLDNLKVLYGTGVLDLDDSGAIVRKGGVKYTVKDGIVFDARALLADVRRMVKEARSGQGTSKGRS